jgi:hypothetical protein
VEERRPLRRKPDDHNFDSLLMLAVTAGAFLLVTRGGDESPNVSPPMASDF